MKTISLLAEPGARVDLVVNAGARSGAAALARVREEFAAGGVRDLRTYEVTSGGGLAAVLDRVVAEPPRLLVVGGGDGTVNAAAARVAGTTTVLGVLPLGTANDFARTLELSSDPAVAAREMLGGKVVDLDVGRANGNAYLNVASFGLSVEVTRRLSPRLKRFLGPAAYAVATLRAFRHHRPFAARLEFPDGDQETLDLDELLQVAVGSGRHYGGGNAVSPTASADDGLLDVYAVVKGGLRDHLSIARLLRDGSQVEHERVRHIVTTAVDVVTTAPMRVNLDGELAATTPAAFRVDRNALHVAVPARSRAGRLDGGT
ncbi:lipid kinase [Myceligenerans xiligouense]|uniref:YegS/Rv2252/BmrU family lipid kinase n=1 Tax=Myceligenerans xiligouense TaxID=253184 RepID=A0A3N4YKP3_9MICO|nr:lipid kinase [Myceligenerans xiligouense]RPF21679.1 YegS/Rv2252/BmrU family lipid kinase [Myceligenerans xiligouense]